MRKIEEKLSESNLTFACLYFADIYTDIKTIKEHYLNTLTPEEQELVLTHFEKLNNVLETIKLAFDVDYLEFDEEMGPILDIKISKKYKEDTTGMLQQKYLEPFFNVAAMAEDEIQEIAKKIWQNTLTNVSNFDQSNYNLLVYKITNRNLNDFKSYRNYLNGKQFRRLSTTYINNQNNKTYFDDKSYYGLVYGLNSKNFLGGCRYDAFTVESSEGLKFNFNSYHNLTNQKMYELFAEGNQKIYSGLDFEYADSYATKTITPKKVEERNKQRHYNEIVLDYVNSKPEAVFYFCYGNKFITPCNLKEVKEIAEYYNVPVIAIDKLFGKSFDMLDDSDMTEIAKSFYFNISNLALNDVDVNYVDSVLGYYKKIVEANPQTKEEFEDVLNSMDCSLKHNDTTENM